ncbi:transglycosylase SLT domain-containing protein [Altererythrobacter soli]|uniref:Transglycosylase SLT domain-containing protein n=1 Tax=Croceibacterium soli TaxID=1739690 RepID=A0A6I4UU32_9SPHN|nr:lytic transglycosylase domain-containing protein [Croceibacterium soli]MXP42422.1 transglycosylase SLT domain-containing protein [Croceibacterium soli]
MLLVSTAPAEAASTREYFTARLQAGPPQQLGQADRTYYHEVFAAIDRGDWLAVETLLAQRPDGLLHTVARAQYYLAANSPRVELPQIEAWLARGHRLPMAAQMARLAMTRGALSMPMLPQERTFYPQSSAPKRVRPRSVEDGTMPAEVRQQILDRISNDDPHGARQLLDGVDALLSPEARAEWRQRVAWSYYIENMDPQALAMARTVADGRGPWVAEGEWAAGLAAWRLNDCASASFHFERAGAGAGNAELRGASYYWASRAALRCRQPERSAQLLRAAAVSDETLYGMLAAEQLGRKLPERLATADLSDADWRRLQGSENVRIAIALAEIGRDVLSSQVLLHEARIGDPGNYAALTRLAREIGLPQTQLYMAHNAPSGAAPDPASAYPTPKWVPVTGWQVDPALAYAHALQESNFRAEAVSPADAKGVMQITPITVREHAPRLGMNASQVNIFDPGTNLAFGQRNLQMLRDHGATQGHLPKIMAAYNAGLTPVTRWNYEVRDMGDPLLYMESIPYWETRSYVAIVTRNYWMYERQAKAPSMSRIALAQNAWPGFPTGQESSGRVYLSAESN